VPRAWLCGVSLIALSMLVLEITLTRFFSLELWYHLAVVSISLALFGTAAGGICVFAWSHRFERHRLNVLLQWSALAYSIAVVASLLVFIGIPILPAPSVAGLVNLTLVYADLAVPFFLGGLTLALAMSRRPAHISAIYFSDLVGAGLGCLLMIPALDLVGGPGTVILAAVIGAVASLAFAVGGAAPARKPAARWLAAAVALLVVNAVLGLITVQYVKGLPEDPKLYERWNSFSRVAVFPEERGGRPFGWGLSGRYNGPNPGWMKLNIDGMATTPITRFAGDFAPVQFLKYDVSNAVYYLGERSKVLIFGPGGGRDVLSALLFGASEIHGVELNPAVVDAMRRPFAAYSGHIYEDPRVTIHVDDGRNFLARSSERYDVIQISAVDTWAATAAGAFALSENTLYTTEAFGLYHDHLADDGILAVSRYVYPRDRYGEALRLTGLALQAWRERGVAEPWRHLLVAAVLNQDEDEGYVSVLMKASPFTEAEARQLEAVSADVGFQVLYTPFGGGHGPVRDFVTAPDYPAYWAAYPIDVSPPTDDRPFFFQMLRLGDIVRLGPGEVQESEHLRLLPVAVMAAFLVITAELALAFIFLPLWFVRRDALRTIPGTPLYLVYFSGLGIGFMMVEIALMQKLSLLLGHPTYTLAVILSVILIASGVGSYLTRFVPPQQAAPVGAGLALVLVLALPGYAVLIPELQRAFMGAAPPLKVAVSVAALLPLGLAMGTLFPLGIKHLTGRAEALVPWCWAVNGATSVFASILSLAVGLQLGITGELVVGWAAYGVAGMMLLALAVGERVAVRARELGQPPAPS
jgi:hypothetical protein